MNTITRLSAAFLATTMALATPVWAAKLKLATIAPDKSIWGVQAKRFAAAVEASGADIQIEYFGGGQLGNMGDTFKSTLSGRVDIWIGAMPVMSAVTPELGLFNLPYLFENPAQAKCTVPKMVGKIREAVGAKYHVLSVVHVDSQSVSAKKAIHVPADLAGLKIRTAPIPASMSFFRSLGATPQPLPAAETPSALATGLVDGVDFGVTYLTLTGAFKTARYYTPTKHNTNLGGYVISARSWAKLSDAQKKALQAAADSMEFGTGLDEVQAFEAIMESKMLAGGGIKVELSDAETAQWVAAGRKVWPQIVANMRGDSKGFMASLEEALASCK